MKGCLATRLALLAAVPLAAGAPLAARAEQVLAIGDSITVGSDDEPVPDDGCPGESPLAGWSGLLSCRLASRGISLVRCAAGGQSSWWGRAVVDSCIAAAPGVTTAVLSLHVNDCGSSKCGSFCAGGARAGVACATDAHCPDSFCDLSGVHACTSQETRDNVKFIVDSLLAASYQRVIFWRSPGSLDTIERQDACAIQEFDGTPDSLDALFLQDASPLGFADDPRVEYEDATYRDFCPGTGLPGCPPDDGRGDRRTWWFAHDSPFVVAAHIHPNAWGYMALAARLGERLVGAPLDHRPHRPTVTLAGYTNSTVSISVFDRPDVDGDPLTIYAWASCIDTSGRSADPACDRWKDTGPIYPRECGAIQGADHDGLGSGGANPDVPTRQSVEVVDGSAEITGLAANTFYRICVVAYDGFQGSYFNDSVTVRTGGRYPLNVPVSTRARGLLGLALAAMGARAAVRGRSRARRA